MQSCKCRWVSCNAPNTKMDTSECAYHHPLTERIEELDSAARIAGDSHANQRADLEQRIKELKSQLDPLDRKYVQGLIDMIEVKSKRIEELQRRLDEAEERTMILEGKRGPDQQGRYYRDIPTLRETKLKQKLDEAKQELKTLLAGYEGPCP